MTADDTHESVARWLGRLGLKPNRGAASDWLSMDQALDLAVQAYWRKWLDRHPRRAA